MSTEGIIVGLVMLALAVLWLALPLFRRRRLMAGSEELARQKERETLLTSYQRTLSVLRDMDEDRLTGKLTQADYDAERGYWADQGVAILEALEKLGVKKPEAKPRKAAARQVVQSAAQQAAAQEDPDAVLDDAIEQAIANYAKSTQ
jgi:hypothetical protein